MPAVTSDTIRSHLLVGPPHDTLMQRSNTGLNYMCKNKQSSGEFSSGRAFAEAEEVATPM